MTEDYDLASMQVAILGLGLMGGSLAMALRGRCAALLGVDTDPATLDLARRMGLADQLSPEAADLLPLADLVILAAPVRVILSLLEDLPDLHPGRAVVIDLGSTKVQIVQAMARLPDRLIPLGGHPICGKERGALANAEAGLYAGAAFVLTPTPCTSSGAAVLGEQLVRALGARPVWLDAETHDAWVALTSHLPYLAANALAYNTPYEARPVAGPGFHSSARLASTPVGIMLDILMTNQEPILAGLRAYRGAMQNWLERGAQNHRRIAWEGK
jgi:prephenate dehydrogenase